MDKSASLVGGATPRRSTSSLEDTAIPTRRLTFLDWLVLAELVLIVCVTATHSGPVSLKFFKVLVPLCILTWATLAAWMFRDGSSSALWNWLPPFWPWGRLLTSPRARWGFVLVMIAGGILGAIATARDVL